MNTHPPSETDALLRQLYAGEEQLQAWVRSSEKNALLFAMNPVAALRAANTGMDEDSLHQLDVILDGIARKLA